MTTLLRIGPHQFINLEHVVTVTLREKGKITNEANGSCTPLLTITFERDSDLRLQGDAAREAWYALESYWSNELDDASLARSLAQTTAELAETRTKLLEKLAAAKRPTTTPTIDGSPLDSTVEHVTPSATPPPWQPDQARDSRGAYFDLFGPISYRDMPADATDDEATEPGPDQAEPNPDPPGLTALRTITQTLAPNELNHRAPEPPRSPEPRRYPVMRRDGGDVPGLTPYDGPALDIYPPGHQPTHYRELVAT